MPWIKKGVVFSTNNDYQWMVSHATYPTPLVLDDRIRVYFAPRGANGQSSITFLDVDRADPTRVMAPPRCPVLAPGKLGTFDDCGVQPNCLVAHDGKIYLYYLGWNPGVNVLARNNTGLAISGDCGETFVRMFDGPVLDRTMHEPYFTYTPWILIEDGIWHAWYGSGRGWVLVDEKAEGLFETKYCYSVDGIHWVRPNITCIPPREEMEVNCRPTVVKQDNTYRMWYSVRKADDFRGGANSYRIGYAESRDRTHWQRMDEAAGIDVTPGDWDSEMICYCSVAEFDGKLHMFYNGNGFGKTGFGYAVWED